MLTAQSTVVRFLLCVLLAYWLPALSDDVSRGGASRFSLPIYTPPSQAALDYNSPSPPSSNPVPPGQTPPRPGPANSPPTVGFEENTVETTASFIRQLQRCVRPGDIIKFRGEHLNQLDGYEITIHTARNKIALIRLSNSDKELIVRIPEKSILEKNQAYRVIFTSSTKKASYSPPELSLLTCLINNTPETNNIDHEPGEVLILINNEQVIALKKAAKSKQLKLIKELKLKSFGETMLMFKTSESKISNEIKSLRKTFPDATIDLNSHYHQAATKARIYAPQMILSRSLSSCGSKNYSDMTIGIIDGEPDLSHPALLNQDIIIKSFLNNSQQAEKEHGTELSAIIVGHQPEAGFEGVLPKIKIMAATALRQDKGQLLATTESIIKSINWLMLSNVRLINISLSGSKPNTVLSKVFAIAIQKKTIIFAAAGNGGKTAPKSYPAALPGVIAITAVDAATRIYKQANQGEYIDFSAPGVDIWVATNDGKGKYSSGTSYASPYAMAVAAFYLSRNPSLSPSLLYDAMKAGSKDLGTEGYDPIYGWGLVRSPTMLCGQ